MPKSEAMARLGTMCPNRGPGSPGTTTLHVCVDQTWQSSRRLTVSPFMAVCLLSTSTPSLMKTAVAPVSTIHCESSIATGQMRGANPSSSWLTGRGETFEAVTVMSSLFAVLHTNRNWVGSRGAETKLLHLFVIDSSAPPCHMGGNCVLCWPFVLGPYAGYVAAFSLFYSTW
jgi:hypothetical protein